jgi:hypothetical protein
MKRKKMRINKSLISVYIEQKALRVDDDCGIAQLYKR